MLVSKLNIIMKLFLPLISSNFISIMYRSKTELDQMKAILKSELAKSFNTNLVKIALNFGEDRIAALIVARFPIMLDEVIIKFAV